MDAFLDYVVANKEWIFSGVGLLVISVFWLLFKIFFSHLSVLENSNEARPLNGADPSLEDNQVQPGHWQGVMPPGSRFKVRSGRRDEVPLGSQMFSFEYSPDGHAHPLRLKDRPARADVQIYCRITNPYKAMFGANEYAINILLPMFLSEARSTLERYSINQIRENRLQVADEILADTSPEFQKLGVALESVTIGDVSGIE